MSKQAFASDFCQVESQTDTDWADMCLVPDQASGMGTGGFMSPPVPVVLSDDEDVGFSCLVHANAQHTRCFAAMVLATPHIATQFDGPLRWGAGPCHVHKLPADDGVVAHV